MASIQPNDSYHKILTFTQDEDVLGLTSANLPSETIFSASKNEIKAYRFNGKTFALKPFYETEKSSIRTILGIKGVGVAIGHIDGSEITVKKKDKSVSLLKCHHIGVCKLFPYEISDSGRKESADFVSTSFDYTVRIWSLSDYRKGKPTPILKHTTLPVSFAASPSGPIFTGCLDKTISVWNSFEKGNTYLDSIEVADMPSSLLAWSDTQLIVGTDGGALDLYDIRKSSEKIELKKARQRTFDFCNKKSVSPYIKSLAKLGDNKIAWISGATGVGDILILDLNSGTLSKIEGRYTSFLTLEHSFLVTGSKKDGEKSKKAEVSFWVPSEKQPDITSAPSRDISLSEEEFSLLSPRQRKKALEWLRESHQFLSTQPSNLNADMPSTSGATPLPADQSPLKTASLENIPSSASRQRSQTAPACPAAAELSSSPPPPRPDSLPPRSLPSTSQTSAQKTPQTPSASSSSPPSQISKQATPSSSTRAPTTSQSRSQTAPLRPAAAELPSSPPPPRPDSLPPRSSASTSQTSAQKALQSPSVLSPSSQISKQATPSSSIRAPSTSRGKAQTAPSRPAVAKLPSSPPSRSPLSTSQTSSQKTLQSPSRSSSSPPLQISKQATPPISRSRTQTAPSRKVSSLVERFQKEM